MIQIPVSKILPNPEQPRKEFDETELEALASSMASPVGLVQPITVRQAEDAYILVDGERRWRAAKRLGWETIEAHVREKANGNENLLLEAMVANIQRSGMKPTEEARAYQKLMHKLGSQEKVAALVGVSYATVALRLGILEFDPKIQGWIDAKRLPLDLRLITALKKLPDDLRLEVVQIALIRGSGIRGILNMCKRRMIDGKPAYAPTSRIKEDVLGKPNRKDQHFDALDLTEKTLPAIIIEALQKTCQKYALYDDASATNCRQCPLVDFIKYLPEDVAESGGGVKFELKCKCGAVTVVKSLGENARCSKCGKFLMRMNAKN